VNAAPWRRRLAAAKRENAGTRALLTPSE
jgi:hypothetical protein